MERPPRWEAFLLEADHISMQIKNEEEIEVDTNTIMHLLLAQL